VPDHIATKLREVQKDVVPDASRHQEIDHVTLVYTKKPTDGGEHPPDRVHSALDSLKDIGADHEPIKARIQGWGYFDGAEKDGKKHTALVALLDAPGLEHLHVAMANAVKKHGIEPSDNHIFTPHITLGYLEQHGRSDKPLPPLSGNFTIDKAHVAARDHHEISLTGASALAKAAAHVVWKDRVSGGLADDKKPDEFPTGTLRQGRKVELEHTNSRGLATEIAMDHLTEDPSYYKKLKQVEEGSLAKAAAVVVMKGRPCR
jgi:2'-5' RNA ligase